MKELVAICEAYKRIDFSRQKAALATVVRVIGSSYRSPGARMLITDDGRWTGSISGGCLEGDALRKARQVMSDKQAITVRYDTNEEDNKAFAINLGCNGVIDVLLEPVDPADEYNPIFLYQSLLGIEESRALAIVFSANKQQVGKKILLKSEFDIVQHLADTDLTKLIRADLLDLLETKKSRAQQYEVDGEFAEVFIELIQPPIHLMIFGGGFDARPLSEMVKN